MAAKVEIDSGICGIYTTVWAKTDMMTYRCKLKITSNCEAIQKLAEEIPEVDAFQEISLRMGDGPVVLRKGMDICFHSACPVPAGIIKAIEVASQLALPQDAIIKVSKIDD
jgi:hypothetical protein